MHELEQNATQLVAANAQMKVSRRWRDVEPSVHCVAHIAAGLQREMDTLRDEVNKLKTILVAKVRPCPTPRWSLSMYSGLSTSPSA